jgi:hypothetical protein
MAGKKDICPVIKNSSSGVELKCTLPRSHIKLFLVKPGDKPSKFKNMASPHSFQPRYPYRH